MDNSNNIKKAQNTYKIREKQYNTRTEFYPEYGNEGTWIALSYCIYGFNLNGKDYCNSYDEAISIIIRHKIDNDNKLIKEIIHNIE